MTGWGIRWRRKTRAMRFVRHNILRGMPSETCNIEVAGLASEWDVENNRHTGLLFSFEGVGNRHVVNVGPNRSISK